MKEKGRLQHFEILTRPDGSLFELGRGAMGVTYRAIDTVLKREVALKVINSALLSQEPTRQRFLLEARAAAAIRHPNVATVLHFGEDEGNYFYAMELIDGETLATVVQEEGVLTPGFALNIVTQVCRGLAAAERHSLVHRDIKPSNIMIIVDDGEILVKLIDFGLAKFIGRDPSSSLGGLTTGGVLGTPHFASPEQLNEDEVDIRSDFYSLGVTLWYMAMGKPPFSGSVAQIISQHINSPLPVDRIAHLPTPLQALILRMTDKDPNKRPQTTADLRREIDAACKGCHAQEEAPAAYEEKVRAESAQLVLGRFRKLKPLESRPGCPKLFLGEDTNNGATVTLMKLAGPAEPGGTEHQRLALLAEQLARTNHPNLLGVLAIGMPWIARSRPVSLTVLEILRARRAFLIAEAFRVLTPAAGVLDHLSNIGLAPERVHPADLHLVPMSSKRPLADLARAPLLEWGEFLVLYDALPTPIEASPDATLVASQSQAAAPGETTVGGAASRLISEFAAFASELFGEPLSGGTRRIKPIPVLGEDGNRVLRLAIEGRGDFANAASFVAALAQATGANLSGSEPAASLPSSRPVTDLIADLHGTAVGLAPLPPSVRGRYEIVRGLPAFAPGQRRYALCSPEAGGQRALLIYSIYAKPVSADMVDRLRELASRLATPPHPAFTRALDYSCAPNESAVVYEWPGDLTLHDVLKKPGRFSYGLTLKLAGTVAAAVEAAVEAGWPLIPIDTGALSAAVNGHNLDDGLTLRIPAPGLPAQGSEEIDPFQTMAIAMLPQHTDVPGMAQVYSAPLLNLILTLLGQPQRSGARAGFRPIPELDAEQNDRVARALRRVAAPQPPTPGEILAILGAPPTHGRAATHPGIAPVAKAAPRPDLGQLVLAVAPSFENRRAAPATKLRIVPQQRGAPLLTLVSGSEVVFGRSPKDADFVAQFHPRNAVNDSRTMRIGRQQLRLTLGEDGIHILNVGTTNPSLWNGRVPQGERLALLDDEVLLAGEFAVRILRTPPRGYSSRRLGTEAAIDDKTSEQAVAILPKRPSESLPCVTLWIFSECGLHLGAGETFLSPWVGQAASPAVVWHRGADAFWIENNSSDARVTLNDIPLLAGSAAYIEVGDRIGLHDARYLVQEC